VSAGPAQHLRLWPAPRGAKPASPAFMTPVSDRPGAMNTPACAACWFIDRRSPSILHQAEQHNDLSRLCTCLVAKPVSTPARHVHTQLQPSERERLTSTVPLMTYCLHRCAHGCQLRWRLAWWVLHWLAAECMKCRKAGGCGAGSPLVKLHMPVHLPHRLGREAHERARHRLRHREQAHVRKPGRQP